MAEASPTIQVLVPVGVRASQHHVRVPVADRARYAQVADEVEARLGPVSLLFNNAGVAPSATAASVTYESWDWGISVNLGGVVNGVQTFLPRMIQRGGSAHIVNTASGAGVAPTSHYLYCTPKYAVVGMSETLRDELRKTGTDISVSVLCPGPVATRIVSRTAQDQPDMENRQEMLDRLKEVEEVLQMGASSDTVGDIVLEAIKSDAPFIFTDRIVEDALIERTEMMLACMPPAPADDDDDPTDQQSTSDKPAGIFSGARRKKKLRGFTLDTHLPAAPADVFALVANPARSGEWSKGHVGFTKAPPEQLELGATFTQELASGGANTVIDWTVSELDPPRSFEIEGKAQAGIYLRNAYVVERSGKGTRLSITMEMGGAILIGPRSHRLEQR